MELPRGLGGSLAVVIALASLAGCARAERPVVERAATAFEDPTTDPEARCDLLAPAVRAAFESQESARCSEAVQDLPMRPGRVESVAIWGGEAQVRLDGDTVFLTRIGTAWRVTAAACTPQPEAPYDCEVEGP